ncbi:TPA: DUF551 domain-containing protein [Raoultella planticola]|uniref:DUF551 domain-containing protein n=1 Tax=Raoultella planticola TaxID=575 RepID=UPI003D04E1DB
MTKSTITRERIELIANFHRAMTLPPSHDEIEELARMSLAAMGSEPVGIVRYVVQGAGKGIHVSLYQPLPEGVELFAAPQPAPVVSFYRDGIEAAAKWIDQQREAYDSEHGWSDPDTGAFEFGNDAQREYSSTLEELAEGIRALHPNAGNSPVIGIDLASGPDRSVEVRYVAPPGYVMVPKEPTSEMQSAGASAIRIETTAVNKLWTGNAVFRAMLAAADSGIPIISDTWIPVCERMPECGDYLVTDGSDFDVQTFDGEQFYPGFVWEDKITHWMPLPAAPQEVKGE